MHGWELYPCLAKPPSRTSEQVTRRRGESVEPWWARPTMLIGRGPTRPHCLQLPLVGRHVSLYPYCTCLSFGFVGFLLHVGPWIHVRLNGALWLVDFFCLGLRSVFPCSWSVFSVFTLISPAYKYLATLVEMVRNKSLPLCWCLHFMSLCRNWRRRIDT